MENLLKFLTNDKLPPDTIVMMPSITTVRMDLTFDSDGSMRLTGYYDSAEILQKMIVIKNVSLPPTVESEASE